MAKLTEKEVIEQITNTDISFLKNDKNYVSDKEYVDTFYDKKEKAMHEEITFYLATRDYYEKAGITRNEIETKELIGYDSYGPVDIPVYADNWDFYIGAISLGLIEYNKGKGREVKFLDLLTRAEEKKEELLEEHAQMIQEYEALVNDPELTEYNDKIDQMAKLKEAKGFFAKMSANRKMKKLDKRLKELQPKAERFNVVSKAYEANETVEKFFEELPKHIKEYKTLLDKYEKAKKEYATYEDDYYNTGAKYEKYVKTKKRIKEVEKAAVDFKLAKLYRENEADFKDTRKTLLMIYAENTDGKFKDGFQDMLKSYDQASKIAKTEGNDFNALKEFDQLKYFQAGQKVVEVENKFENTQNGKGKE